MKYSRRKKLIKRRLQIRVIFIFFVMACIAVMIQAIVVDLAFIRLAERLVDGADVLKAELPRILASSLLISMSILLPLMLVVGVLVTFRIAGPIYRFEMHLKALARGENPGKCRIRKRDELQEMCTILNEAVETLQRSAPTGAVPRDPALVSSESGSTKESALDGRETDRPDRIDHLRSA